MSDLLRAKDVAKELRVSNSTVWRYAATGILPRPRKLSEKVSVWNRTDVEKLYKGGENDKA